MRVLAYRAVARGTDLILAVVAAGAVFAVLSFTQYLGILTGFDWLEDGSSGIRIGASIAAAVAAHLYNSVHLVATTGRSLGKKQLGLGVFSASGPVGYGAAVIREVLALLVVPALAAVVQPERRGGHDLAAGTRVWSTDAARHRPGVLRDDARVLQIIGQIVVVVLVVFGLLSPVALPQPPQQPRRPRHRH